ncbi:MAG: type I glyceraldehyde-3-phosphate dehydrogenase [bacterium]|nr:type I glyceraldehyde-3-phosphate dehydrogenase [bacterium]
MAKIAINGFGRIGRLFFRDAFGSPDFDIVAVNDLTDTATLSYLLKYDSVYGRYGKKVESGDGFFSVDGTKVQVFSEKDPSALPWGKLSVDVVVESTGFFTEGEKAKAHLTAGAKRVVISAPAKGEVATLLVGVNDDLFGKTGPITCNASCTTNSVAPVLAILDEAFGIVKAGMSTTHGYTATQKLVDAPDSKDLRRGRAAAVNIVPSTTGAAEAVVQAMPQLKDKFDAVSLRVPVIAGSISVITVLLKKKTTLEELNKALEIGANSPRFSKTVKASHEPLVSTDIIGELYGAVIDLGMTKLMDGDFAQVLSWYDNEAGYTATLVEHVRRVAANL